MKIHEYQAKQILKQYKVPVPRGVVATTVDEAVRGAQELGGSIWVVKAQIHAGGRGLGGGVKLARSIDEVRSHADEILGMQLITHQTGPEGQKVRKLYIEEGVDIARELYLGLTLDRQKSQLCLMASTEGGTSIEEVAEETPELIHKVWVDPAIGFRGYQANQLAYALGLNGTEIRSFAKFAMGLYKAYTENDASLAEINPLVVTGSGDVIALDCKLTFDDNALYRQPAAVELRDLDEEDPAEVEAGKYQLSYINLDGDIGCLVNGAGLAMATMDTLQHYGGSPANFLDVGGSATAERVSAAFRIILQDEVHAILVNIFGGITRGEEVAKGIVEALGRVDLRAPIVIRLDGTNAEEGRQILADAGIPESKLRSEPTMLDAARAAVALAKN